MNSINGKILFQMIFANCISVLCVIDSYLLFSSKGYLERLFDLMLLRLIFLYSCRLISCKRLLVGNSSLLACAYKYSSYFFNILADWVNIDFLKIFGWVGREGERLKTGEFYFPELC